VVGEGEVAEAGEDFGVAEAHVAEQLGVHADRGEAGEGVDLVEVGLEGGAVDQEVDAGQALAAGEPEGAQGDVLQAGDQLGGQVVSTSGEG